MKFLKHMKFLKQNENLLVGQERYLIRNPIRKAIRKAIRKQKIVNTTENINTLYYICKKQKVTKK